ncbi:MAG: alpha/beta fold hydrolase [Panacagrimonas sp.]
MKPPSPGMDAYALIDELYQALLDMDRFPDIYAALTAHLDGAVLNQRLEQFQHLQPHLQRAAQMVDRVRSQTDSAAASVLADESVFGLIINAEAEIEQSTREARRRLGVRPQRLCDLPLEAEAQRKARQWLRGLRLAGSTPRPLVLSSADQAGARRHWLAFMPLPAQEGQSRGLVRMTDLGWSPEISRMLTAAYQLTEAEIAVTRALFEGDSAAAISSRRGRSLHTVRTQIKHILAKTQCENQAALVQLVTCVMFLCSGPAQTGLPTQAAATKARAASTQQWSDMRLADGRTLSYVVQGAASGRPCIFFNGGILSPELPPAWVERLAMVGVCVIGVARPGYGRSTPRADSQPMTAIADDTVALLDHLGLGPAMLMGMMIGAMHAHYCAQAHPQRFRGLVLAAGALPWNGGERLGALPANHRIWGMTAKHTPHLVTPIAHLANKFVLGGREDRILDMAFGHVAVDREWMQKEQHADFFRDSIRFWAEAPATSFSRELEAQVSDWAPSTRHGLPMRIIHGDQDLAAPLSAVQAFYAQHPNTQVQAVSGAGQLLLYSHPEAVLDALDVLC